MLGGQSVCVGGGGGDDGLGLEFYPFHTYVLSRQKKTFTQKKRSSSLISWVKQGVSVTLNLAKFGGDMTGREGPRDSPGRAGSPAAAPGRWSPPPPQTRSSRVLLLGCLLEKAAI